MLRHYDNPREDTIRGDSIRVVAHVVVVERAIRITIPRIVAVVAVSTTQPRILRRF